MKYNNRNIVKRLEREIRHNKRAVEEKSKTLVGFEFIEDIEVYFYEGNKDIPKDEYAVHFVLKYPILFEHFKEFLNNKLSGAVVNE